MDSLVSGTGCRTRNRALGRAAQCIAAALLCVLLLCACDPYDGCLLYTSAAFEAAQQRKEKPWQSWDEAFSERLAKQPFITEEERKPFAPSGSGAQNAFYTGEKQPWPGLGLSLIHICKAAARGAPGRPRGRAEKYPAPGRCSKFRDKCVVE